MASSLVEIAKTSQLHIQIEEDKILVQENVRGACEMLGLDPLYVANEGCFVCFVPESDSKRAVEIMQKYAVSKQACKIGNVISDNSSEVTLKTTVGTSRYVDMLSGEQLPRIC